jgi:hypothetical protein
MEELTEVHDAEKERESSEQKTETPWQKDEDVRPSFRRHKMMQGEKDLSRVTFTPLSWLIQWPKTLSERLRKMKMFKRGAHE